MSGHYFLRIGGGEASAAAAAFGDSTNVSQTL